MAGPSPSCYSIPFFFLVQQASRSTATLANWQAIKYASYCSNLTADEIYEILAEAMQIWLAIRSNTSSTKNSITVLAHNDLWKRRCDNGRWRYAVGQSGSGFCRTISHEMRSLVLSGACW